jgi:hypothetical protein
MEKVKEPEITRKHGATGDKIKEMLEKYKFKPEFIPSKRQLLSNLTSIHELKIKKLNLKGQLRGAGK